MQPHSNRLMAALPLTVRQRLLAQCELIPMHTGMVLCEQGQPLHQAYFVDEGIICLLVGVAGHPGLEVAMLGHEGMLGIQLMLGVATMPWQALVQTAGTAWRIRAVALRAEIGRSPALRRCLERYLCVCVAQLANDATCLHFHLIVPRLARWLLMGLDRTRTDTLHVTHEALSCLLGVRRVGITVAAGGMQASGLIRYRRGELTVLDRPGLAALACPCHALQQATYEMLMKPHVRHRTDARIRLA